ncbi:MAG: 2-oxoacid:ferredoxin oxidoreductase subunit gamma [Deltaproteobacteria bacterium]|nr:2-oxoacid:ferredoxin oxidoreductase subunit gamma [Deltaproteobacteria bacterium]
MSNQRELRLAGLGGQGIILAGIILAEAAGIYDGKFVAQTQAYGAAARGGFSRSDVLISDEEINYPKARNLDVLLAMSQDAYEDNLPYLKPDGILIVDSTYVADIADAHVYAIPFTRIARETFRRENVANIISLGAISQISPYISEEAMASAVVKRVPPRFLELNKKAFEAGKNAAKEAVQRSMLQEEAADEV